MTTRVLFVCSGNICRSPTAEGVMRHLVGQAGLETQIEVDGAGTGAWHVGESPDPRSTETAAARGITLTGRARAISVDDFESFDHILAVDEGNLAILRDLAPAGSHARVTMLDTVDVPDPYYGGPDGFEKVLDQITAACARLLEDLRPV